MLLSNQSIPQKYAMENEESNREFWNNLFFHSLITRRESLKKTILKILLSLEIEENIDRKKE
jgi:hypothetical protein